MTNTPGSGSKSHALTAALRRLFPPRGEHLREPFDYVFEFGCVRDVVLSAAVYLPNFVEVHGSILFDRGAVWSDSFLDSKNAGKKPLWELERDFNYVEISHLFNAGMECNAALSVEDEVFLVECVAEAWRGRLALLYPTRRFELTIIGPPESGDMWGIRFWELR
jgi:hypothetical protein